jgi:hypothetical protein
MVASLGDCDFGVNCRAVFSEKTHVRVIPRFFIFGSPKKKPLTSVLVGRRSDVHQTLPRDFSFFIPKLFAKHFIDGSNFVFASDDYNPYRRNIPIQITCSPFRYEMAST